MGCSGSKREIATGLIFSAACYLIFMLVAEAAEVGMCVGLVKVLYAIQHRLLN